MKCEFGLLVSVIVLFFSGCENNKNLYSGKNDQSAEVQRISQSEEGGLAINLDIKSLIAAAAMARQNAYCPYSKFKVGAAVLTISGKVYTGCNVENASYGLTLCAERNAIFKAVSEGERGNFVKAIAIVLDAPDYGAPCGACRQVINEFAEPEAIIVMASVNGKYKIEMLKTLLPYAFKFEAK